jgi:hypothetical protein
VLLLPINDVDDANDGALLAVDKGDNMDDVVDVGLIALLYSRDHIIDSMEAESTYIQDGMVWYGIGEERCDRQVWNRGHTVAGIVLPLVELSPFRANHFEPLNWLINPIQSISQPNIITYETLYICTHICGDEWIVAYPC